jgi:hypothetical protein
VELARGAVLTAGVDAAVEDQADAVGAAEVEVVVDDLLEEDPPRHRTVEHLGEGELGLQDRDVVAVAGRPVLRAEGVRQEGEPLAQQGVDLRRAQGVAQALHGCGVVDGGEGVVQRGEADPSLGRLPFGPLVAVDAQLGVEGEVAAELEEKRAEVLIHAVEVEVVDHPGGACDPRVGAAVFPAPLLDAEERGLLLGPPDEQHPLGALEAGQVLMGEVVLALALGEVHPRHGVVAGEGTHRLGERLGERRDGRRGGHRHAQLPVDVADQTGGVLQLGYVDVEVHPVDALHLEEGVHIQDVGHGAR